MDEKHERTTSVVAKKKWPELSSESAGQTAALADDITPRVVSSLLEKQEDGPGLAPLNFRVSAAFRREFKTFAAQHDLKLNELLRRSFEAYRLKEK
jgi:hypothetical protein